MSKKSILGQSYMGLKIKKILCPQIKNCMEINKGIEIFKKGHF